MRRIVDNDDIDRAHIADGRIVILTEDELAELPAECDHEMDVVEFVPVEQVDVPQRELDMAKDLVDSLSADFAADAFGDDYQNNCAGLSTPNWNLKAPPR